MKKKFIAMTLAVFMGISLAACGSKDEPAKDNSGTQDNKTEDNKTEEDKTEDTKTDDASGVENNAASGDVANKDKPLVWFNRQPSNSSTGELDMAALSFNNT